jgi:hypothetical protein
LRELPWLPRLAPSIGGMVALVVLGSASVGAAGPPGPAHPWDPPDCTGGRPAIAAAAATGRSVGPEEADRTPWFRLDPATDASGSLTGQHLTLGRGARNGAVRVDLPPESAVAGPFGDLVLLVADDGARSRIVAVDSAAGCALTLAEEAAVVRRATLDLDGSAIYETRVDRASRVDLGVWRRSLEGVPPEQVLGPLPPDDRFGQTWSTELSWAMDGGRLIVQSCGYLACRTRLLDPRGGESQLLDDPDLGELIGVAGDQVLTYAACHGLPCAIIRTDLATGDHRVLADDAALALVVETPSGPRLVHETSGPEAHLRVVDLLGLGEDLVTELPAGVRLVPSATRAGAALATPPGWALLAPDGRVGAAGEPSWLFRPTDGRLLRMREMPR